MIDLRSDTVTKPTEGMRQAMAHAEVGDDVYGEDPTVAELQERVAGLFGFEAALFTPTGSMANVLALAALVGPGQEVICESRAHILRAELGAHGALTGLTSRTWVDEQGQIDLDTIRQMHAPDMGPFFVRTTAISVENTHNFAGGTVQPLAELQALRSLTAEAGVAVHLDGARLWNAHVATGVPLAEYGRLADTVSVCLSKGLGAPVGSVLVGSAARIAEARVWRKRYGGGMRQVGVLAAAGAYALDHHLAGLAADHARAKRLAAAIAAADESWVNPADVETNIVVLAVPDAARTARDAAAAGVRISVLGRTTARLVTHRDLDDEGTERACDVLSTLARSAR
jgi:threonine aldolase